MPQSNAPVFNGWQIAASWKPARSVSGDFYDFLQLDDRRWGVVVGDVTGNGVPGGAAGDNIYTLYDSTNKLLPGDVSSLSRAVKRALTCWAVYRFHDWPNTSHRVSPRSP